MFGLPPQTDLTFLGNSELLQVCIGLHQVIMRFDKEITISLECEYWVNGIVQDQMGVVGVLGHRITAVVQGEGGQITARFSSGSLLEFRDSNSCYESYQITAPGRHIVV